MPGSSAHMIDRPRERWNGSDGDSALEVAASCFAAPTHHMIYAASRSADH